MRRLLILLSAFCLGAPATSLGDDTSLHAFRTEKDFRAGLSAYNSADYDTAIRIWSTLAGADEPKSQAGLGFIYYAGLGTPVDHGQAAYWLRRAAEHNQPEGQMLLGRLYLLGRGVPQSNILAYAWCDIASTNGQPTAGGCRNSALQQMATHAEMLEAYRVVVVMLKDLETAD